MFSAESDIQKRYGEIDQHYLRYLETHDVLHERWLLEQTVYTSAARRGILSMLPVSDGNRVLDIGTGFGALAFDFAALKSVHVDALDMDPEVLACADGIYQTIQGSQLLQPGSDISFRLGNVYELPFEDHSIDFAMARFVYQHLEEPSRATAEIKRVLKPGGFLCLMDVDDQFTLTYPNGNGSFEQLREIFHKLQIRKGGDRFVGRKLASFMHDEGLGVVGSVVQPESYFTAAKENDPGLALTARRFRELKSEILDAALMTDAEFEFALEGFLRDMTDWHYHASGTVIVIGQKPILNA